jgi:hypothetical protein
LDEKNGDVEDNQSSSRSRLSFWHVDNDARGSQEELQSVASDDMLHRSLTMSSDGMNSTNSSSRLVSRALEKVLDQHRAKVSASNPQLEPKGISEKNNYKPSSNKERDVCETPRQQSQWHVAVQRWGIRNRRLSGHKHDQVESKAEQQQLDLIGKTENPDPPGKDTEIEFEIEITLCSPNISENTGLDKTEDPSKTGNRVVKSSNNRSVVWRSAHELLRLHTVLVSLQGDYAPRRPRLKSAQVDLGHSLINADLLVDMRSISCKYCTAVLLLFNHNGVELFI